MDESGVGEGEMRKDKSGRRRDGFHKGDVEIGIDINDIGLQLRRHELRGRGLRSLPFR